MSCILEVKTLLKGQFVVLEETSLNATVGDLYKRVSGVEDTPDGKWKLMLIVKSPRTLKPIRDQEKQLKEYGAEDGSKYRVEVILDMGACHTTCKRN
jgi:hypothetical protein